MDKNHFSRAIGNILKNAIQAVVIGNQGDIEVALEEESGSALITIRDNGIGISEAMEPFVFVPNFSTKTSGSGIGLSTSKTLIEHAGGSISFQSKPQEGTKFFIRLPLKS
jgi:signal transduction histidine kinase